VRTWILFTNPIADTRNAILLIVSKRSAKKEEKRIGEIGELYEIFIFILNIFDSLSNTLIMVILFRKKLVTQRIIISGIFLFRRLSSNRVCETLSNASKIFI
jgi:hypothetical protein